MKRTYSLFLISLIFLQVRSQTGGVDSGSRYVHRLDLIKHIEFGSNGVNNQIMNRFAFGGYISGEMVADAEKLIKDRNHAGFLNITYAGDAIRKMNYKKGPRTKTSEVITLRYSQMNVAGMTFSREAFQLFMRGNSDFAGREMPIGKLQMKQWITRGLEIQYPLREMAGKSISLHVTQVLAYRNIISDKSKVYTDSFGDYVDTYLAGAYENSGRDNGWGRGIGLGVGYSAMSRAYGGTLALIVRNVGASWIPNLHTYWKNYSDSSRMGYDYVQDPERMQIEQKSIDQSGLNNYAWTNEQKDSIVALLKPQEARIGKWKLNPFTVDAYFVKHQWYCSLNYINLPGYWPRLNIRRDIGMHPLGGIFTVSPIFSLGGFEYYDLGIFIQASLWKDLGINFQFSGLESLAFPKLEHGTVFRLNLNYSLKGKFTSSKGR